MLDEVACWAAKEATVGVVGLEADGLDDEIANTCVGKAEDDGALDEGRIGTSSEDGRCAFGSELGVESRLTAAIILESTSQKSEVPLCAVRKYVLWSERREMLLDVFYWHPGKFGCHCCNRIPIDLSERRTCKPARKLHIGSRLE